MMSEVSGDIQLPTLEEDDEGTLDEPVLTTLVSYRGWIEIGSAKLFSPSETRRKGYREEVLPRPRAVSGRQVPPSRL